MTKAECAECNLKANVLVSFARGRKRYSFVWARILPRLQWKASVLRLEIIVANNSCPDGLATQLRFMNVLLVVSLHGGFNNSVLS